MIANVDDDGHGADAPGLTAEDVHWLHQLEITAPTRALLPMRATEKLGKLGLIELRSSKLMLTERGQQLPTGSKSVGRPWQLCPPRPRRQKTFRL